MIFVAGKAMWLVAGIVQAQCDEARLNTYVEYFREGYADDCSAILPVRKA